MWQQVWTCFVKRFLTNHGSDGYRELSILRGNPNSSGLRKGTQRDV
jgi:hypothetical protein